MIVRQTPEGMMLIRQTDHALLSGALAAAWAWEFPHRESVLVAVARHDDGWAHWELSPHLSEDGQPLDFMTTPVEQHVQLYRYGIDLVEVEDPYAGLIVSLHGQRLYTHPFVDGGPARIDNLTDRDLDLAKEYVEYETQRQALLAETAISVFGGPLVTGDLVADMEEAWRLLQVWDRLSLYACMSPVDESFDLKLPAVRGPDGEDVRIQATGNSDGVLLLDPYPFEGPQSFEVAALQPEGAPWPDERAYRQAYRLARHRPVEVRVGPSAGG